VARARHRARRQDRLDAPRRADRHPGAPAQARPLPGHLAALQRGADRADALRRARGAAGRGGVTPGAARSTVVVEPARPEPGYWAGRPSGLGVGAETWLAYRERDPQRRGGRVVVARSRGGARFEPVVILDQERFGAASLERPALALTGDGRWRLYVSCATP